MWCGVLIRTRCATCPTHQAEQKDVILEAGDEALYLAANEAEAAAMQTLMEIFLSHRKPRDVSEARQVELKRWTSVWAYVMDGRRLFVGALLPGVVPNGPEEPESRLVVVGHGRCW